MTSTQQGSFTIRRTFDAAPARVFKAFADIDAKTKWFAAPNGEWEQLERTFDFREGGKERLRGRWASGMITDFDCTYYDIVPDKRIVYCYEMHQNQNKISVSLATLEFQAAGKGTAFTLTEHGAFLDGYDDAGKREHGTGLLMDQLAKSLENQS
ncbi:MAG TPA: SRPBCC family protein [Rhizomicrobium sp.]|jgi:uncharacterized protein YndB with AHSA1/START domain|nr:SRPBCC family protein [Rhizomicrobium sp.]